MLKNILGIAPKLESDGSYSPSKLALKLATVNKTDYEKISYSKYNGKKSKILVVFTEQKNLKMKNGKLFSTGNHPIEALLPMLHLKKMIHETQNLLTLEATRHHNLTKLLIFLPCRADLLCNLHYETPCKRMTISPFLL